MWIDHPDCHRLISKILSKSIFGCPIQILAQKLKNMKKELKAWNKDVFGNVHLKVQQAQDEVDLIQEETQTVGYSDALCEKEKKPQVALQNALHL